MHFHSIKKDLPNNSSSDSSEEENFKEDEYADLLKDDQAEEESVESANEQDQEKDVKAVMVKNFHNRYKNQHIFLPLAPNHHNSHLNHHCKQCRYQSKELQTQIQQQDFRTVSCGRMQDNKSYNLSLHSSSDNCYPEHGLIPLSSSASAERLSIQANYDSSDFSPINSHFHSEFSIAVASASSNEEISAHTSEPSSLRNLNFLQSNLEDAKSSDRSSETSSDKYLFHERYSDLFSVKCSKFSVHKSITDFTKQSEDERFSDDSLERLIPSTMGNPIKSQSVARGVLVENISSYMLKRSKITSRRHMKNNNESSKFYLSLNIVRLFKNIRDHGRRFRKISKQSFSSKIKHRSIR